MYSAYQLDYWQVGGITQFEVPCFSVCSIQCHIVLDQDADCSLTSLFLLSQSQQLIVSCVLFLFYGNLL